MSNVICPVSSERIANQQVRRIASLVFLFGIFALVFAQNRVFVGMISLILAVDFSIRAFTSLPISPLVFLSKNVLKFSIFGNDNTTSDRAPKRFAAGLGFVFSLGMGSSAAFGFPILTVALSGALTVCALLEAAFSVCLGCYVFVVLKKVFPNI